MTNPQNAEAVADRVELLTEEQRQRVLWRVITRNPQLVNAIVDEFEASGWTWGR